MAIKDQNQPQDQDVDGLDDVQLRAEARRQGIADADTLDASELREQVRQRQQ